MTPTQALMSAKRSYERGEWSYLCVALRTVCWGYDSATSGRYENPLDLGQQVLKEAMVHLLRFKPAKAGNGRNDSWWKTDDRASRIAAIDKAIASSLAAEVPSSPFDGFVPWGVNRSPYPI
jgi:hypothetical protein